MGNSLTEVFRPLIINIVIVAQCRLSDIVEGAKFKYH